MPQNHETTRVRNLSDRDLRDYIDMHGTDSPERKHALHVLEDRHRTRSSRKPLLEIVVAIATVVAAFSAWPQISGLFKWLWMWLTDSQL